MTLVTPPPQIPRDRWNRPMVTPPGGGKPVPYTRCTTFIDCLEDKFNLQKWQQRMVALGLADRPDLLLGVTAHRDDKKALDRYCEDAREAAAASAKATTGTALHALTELVDRGEDLPPLPDEAKADLDAYAAATEPLKAVHIERFTVHDKLKVGGTPDRIVNYNGELYVADLKTGSIEYGALKIAMQLSIYSASQLYTPGTGERSLHGASLTRGIIIHLPAGEATCNLHWVDLETGWEAVNVAKHVREQRRHKFSDLTEPFAPPGRPSLRREKADQARATRADEQVEAKLLRIIAACDSPEQLRALYPVHEHEWTPALTAAAKNRIAELTP